MRNFGLLMVRNIWVAGAFAGIFGVMALRLPPFAIISSALVALVALREGWQRGALMAVIAGVIVSGGWWWLGSRPGLAFPLVFALWPPLLFMTAALRKSGTQGPALLVAGGVMLAFVLVMHVVTDDVVAFWHEWLKSAVASVPGATVKGFEENDTIRLMNGFMALFYGLCLMLALLLGRWMQSIVFHPGGFAPEFRQLTLPRWLLPLAVALIWAGGLWNKMLLADLLMISILLYFFVGLAVIHGVIAVRGLSLGWLVPVYLLIIFFPPQGLAGLALLGVVDTFVHFRVQQGRS
ncbi:MAG: hypothetical protein LUO80_10030 [Methylococcaceae bacterium]|nr:hypothetical protein [Methylococcaceae bacterium]